MNQSLHLLLPTHCRSEAFAEDLLDAPSEPIFTRSAWRQARALLSRLAPAALAVLCGAAAVFGLAASSRATLPAGPSTTVFIDQPRAEAGLPEIGDEPGFPVTIRVPALVRLGTDLRVPAGHRGIVVEADGVRLDLGGHHLQGALDCGSAGSCIERHRSLLSGVQVLGQDADVRHGRISGFEGNGLHIAGRGRVEDLQLLANAGHGLQANTSPARPVQVHGVVAVDNGGAGVWLQNGRIDASHARRNGAGGFALGALALMAGSSAAVNRGPDIDGGQVQPPMP